MEKASRWKNRLAYLLVCALVCGLYLAGSLDFAEKRLDELKFTMTSRPATGNVVLVEIDARSLWGLGVWPWPRGFHAAVVDNLVAAGAGRIAFDVDFSALSTVEDDAKLKAALQRAAGKVVLPAFKQRASDRADHTEIVQSLPLPEFRPFAQIAAFNVFASADGKVRDLYLWSEIDGDSYPTLAFLLAGRLRYPHPAFSIDFSIDPATVQRLSYVDVLKGSFDPAAVAGKQIVIGSTAAELGDRFAAPARITLPGVMLHILGYESLVQGRAIQRLGEIPIVLLVTILVAGLALTFERVSFRAGLIASVAAGGAVFAAAFAIQAYLPLQVDTVPLALAAYLPLVAAMSLRLDRQSMGLLFQGIEIRRKNAMMRNLIEKSIVGVIVADGGGRIRSINKAAATMFGCAAQDLDGASIARVLPGIAWNGEDGGPLRLDASVGQHELSARRWDGAYFPVEISLNAVRDDRGSNYVAFVNDITLRRQQEKELAFRADHDALTGLPNRASFSRKLESDIRRAAAAGTKIAVCLLDLDRFKDVNDTLGHAVGDRLLQDVSRRLADSMPDGAVLSRFGGDEYAVYLPYADGAGTVESFARGLLTDLRQPFEVNEITLEVGGSIGAAIYPEDGDGVDELLQRADVAMYGAKRAQSGFARYWADDDANSVRNLTLAGDLRRAIEDGSLELAFQPKVDLGSGAVSGAEVLCRWHREGHGFVPPDEFITHAEQSGLIFPLTQCVLRKAIERGALWRDMGWDLQIAVNISARLLHHEKILDLVSATLRQWGYPPERLTLEITENALLVNPAHAMIVINELAGLGIKVSIDDFGTGYSSLSYLATLPAAEVKIDKSFVLGMEKNRQFRTIIKSVIGMAHDLDLRVVAEGIETADTREALRRMGCDTGQGYLFGKPMRGQDFESWLKSTAGNGAARIVA